MYILAFLSRLQEHQRRQKAHSRYTCSFAKPSAQCSVAFFHLAAGGHRMSRTALRGSLELSCTYGKTLCLLPAGYNSWDELFSEPGNPQLCSRC